MSAEKRGGHSDTVLEGRHLLGIFFAVVVLCALFFTLGFVLGRNQSAQQASVPPPAKPQPAPAASEPQARDLTFYDRVEKPPPSESLPQAKPAETKPAPPKPSAANAKPIYLQIAAVSQEADAKRLVSELHKLGFDSEIRPPKEDQLYRVMVGPLENDDLATAAQHRLEAQGFRGILRR